MGDLRLLYLDTADLMTIGDGKEDPAVVRELFAHCRRLDMSLAVSMWHVADLRNAAVDARERVVAAIDSFPQLAFARFDGDEPAFSWLPSFDWLLDKLGDDVQEFYERTNRQVELWRSADQRPPRSAVPVSVVNVGLRIALEVVQHANSEDEAKELARAVLLKSRRKVPADRVDVMVFIAEFIWMARQEFEKYGVYNQQEAIEAIVDARAKREVADVGDRSVGKHIGTLVDQRRRGQHDRRYHNGDLADQKHVQFAPYVDIFTGDKDICAWLNEWRSKIAYERPVVAISNRNLRRVVTTLEVIEQHDTALSPEAR